MEDKVTVQNTAEGVWAYRRWQRDNEYKIKASDGGYHGIIRLNLQNRKKWASCYTGNAVGLYSVRMWAGTPTMTDEFRGIAQAFYVNAG